MDHDRLFKELLNAFFVEFVALFLPDVAGYIDAASIEFLDKEVFTDVTAGDKHEVDVLVKARFRGQDTFFLIHVENQASAQSDFPKRMFRYFARLLEKFDLPIYPVVIFSYDAPLRAEPNRYTVAFPGGAVLQFKYKVIQLNRLPWRRFVNQPNPVAAALMAKMKMAPQDRPKVKLECLRLLATLRLDPARSQLIGGFIDSYLKLNPSEIKRYEREFDKLAPQERDKTMVMMSDWSKQALEQGMQQGMQQGMHKGKAELVARLVSQRFGSMPSPMTEHLDTLTADQLDQLGVALLDFASITDVEAWLNRA